MEEENQKKEKVKNKICEYLKQGMSKKDAAIMAGISEATFYRWMVDESFESRAEASILEYKHTLVNNVTKCAEKDGRLALEVLKRRFPNEWGENAHSISQEMDDERKGVVALLEAVYKEETPIMIDNNSADLNLIS